MKDCETVLDYFTKIRSLTNQMKSCGEEMREQLVVDKVLRPLVPKFDHVVVAIEESKDLEQFKIDELHSSLEAHEQRIKERSQDRGEQQPQAPQAYSYKGHSSQGNFSKKGKGRMKTDKGRSNDKSGHNLSSNFSKYQANRKHKKKFDKSKIQCYNCKNLEHFVFECIFKHENVGIEEARLAHEDESNEEQVILMVTTEKDQVNGDCWYLDTGCSNHMTGQREWFTNHDESAKSRVKFADHSFIESERIGDISIQRKDGRYSSIHNVLYVPKMKSNLLSMGNCLKEDTICQ
ncbi:PREDICTED: uncharacterized protein LOC109329298 [Lupinus angustifolius]|uniref:uncharacterized protein LOC109329298 n=1 Tax=Lupinus angustifolius TaxID=3871 RepID=UPI00092F0F7B|nr:PREDICTED: uncharacterized protein LOC109329298 [Lupinus angustifolius]